MLTFMAWYADDVTLPVGVGVGWDVNIHGTLMMLRCPLGVGWGGVGWDVNLHGMLMMLRCPLGLGWGGVGC